MSLNKIEQVIVILSVASTSAFIILALAGCIIIIIKAIYLYKKRRRIEGSVEMNSEVTLDDEESINGSTAVPTRQLRQAPPPSYQNASQYESVDLEHTDVARLSVYRLTIITTFSGQESINPPPTYSSTVGEESSISDINVDEDNSTWGKETVSEDHQPPSLRDVEGRNFSEENYEVTDQN